MSAQPTDLSETGLLDIMTRANRAIQVCVTADEGGPSQVAMNGFHGYLCVPHNDPHGLPYGTYGMRSVLADPILLRFDIPALVAEIKRLRGDP